ncbi:MAG: glycosyltransferase [Duncaniella sp.]|nr:glycosyltransferase [Duncaniella sp.]
MEKITALVQTYNASKYLDRVLSSLKDFDELLVVDMESTDDTLDIARRHGARIITYPRG